MCLHALLTNQPVVFNIQSDGLQKYDLETVKNGDRVGIVCTSSGTLQFYVNGQLKGELLNEKVPKLRHALVDLYGSCVRIKLLPLENTLLENELLKDLYGMFTSVYC